MKPSISMLAVVRAVISLVVVSLLGCTEKQAPPAAQGPVEVVVAAIFQADVPLNAELPGRVVPLRVAEVRPQVGGILQRRLFVEGSNVEAQTQLYQIEDAQYRAEMAAARAELARSEAVLSKARLRERRLKKLRHTNAVSEEDYDMANAELREAQAGVAAARAALSAAEIDLAYTRIVAPISGRIGTSKLTEGALVEAEQDTPLAVIQQIDSVYVDITQSSTEVLRIKRELASGRLSRETETMKVSLILDDGSHYEHHGTLQFAEVSVDESTSSVTLRCIVPNPDHLLLPGMFVRAVIEQGVRKNSLLAPQRGVTYDYSGRPLAMVVGADNKAERRVLKVGPALGDQWLILDGLESGDQVIIEGLQKIREGAPVVPVVAANSVQTEH